MQQKAKNCYKDILPNGIRVITEPMPHLHSVSLGIMTHVGSCNETPSIAGSSHFLEHMLFKGTQKRSAKEIAEAMESVGGQLNAFTAKDHTCYYAKCLSDNFGLSVDLLADMFTDSLIGEDDFNMEKEVILEEINMYDDTPDDLVHDLFSSVLWPEHVYGRAIIGSRDSVQALSAADLRAHYRNSYLPQSTVISVAGNVEREQALSLAGEYFSGFSAAGERLTYGTPAPVSGNGFIHKDIEQSHICIGFPSVREYDDDYYPLMVLNCALGGGASSRLFQEAREKKGLTYSIYSYNSSYSLGGYWAAYSSANPQKLPEIVKIIMQEIASAKEKGLGADEFEKAKRQLRGGIILSYENNSNVMLKNGRSELVHNRIISMQDSLDRLETVQLADVLAVARRIFDKNKACMALVGPKELNLDIKSML